MTQEQLAIAAGLRRTDVNRYVRDRQRLGEKNARKIARALSVSPQDLGMNGELGSEIGERLDAIEELLTQMNERLAAIELRLAGL